MRKTRFIGMLLALLSQSTFARIVYYGSECETLTVVSGMQTIFRFDEEVKAISQASNFSIEPADPIDPNYRILAVNPIQKGGTSQVAFILANDSVVTTKIEIVSGKMPEKADNFYDFKPKESQLDAGSRGLEGSTVSELELMKAMIRSDKVVGYTERSLIRTVNSGIEEISAKLMKVYSGPKFNGYVFKIVNESSSKSYAVDLKSLTLGRPNVALISQVDESILKPGGSKESATFLRIVAKPTSVYYSLTLPVAPIVEK